jgi:NAD+ synthase
MTDHLTITLAQLNPTVGAIAANADKIRAARVEAAKAGADLMLVPEMMMVGYPVEDLINKPSFVQASMDAVAKLAKDTADGGPAIIVGGPYQEGDKVYNTQFLLVDGEIKEKRFKHHLPNYGVFDEKRVFASGPFPEPINFKGVNLGVMTCEDMWFSDVTDCLDEAGAEILIVPLGSPFCIAKHDEHLDEAKQRVKESGLPLIFLNLIGGQDELVFDGVSFIMDNNGVVTHHLKAFEEQVMHTNWVRGQDDKWSPVDGTLEAIPDDNGTLYQALTLGLRDYVAKNGFPGVLIGLSGGVDSALTAAIAVDALGADRVRTVMMPSKYTSRTSLDDAAGCAEMLCVQLDSIDIEPMVAGFGDALGPFFEGLDVDSTEENIQARIRGVLLMGLSNKFGHMVVATGNKSEMSVGYSTLYGDLCGGYALLKDLYKTKAFELCHWRNANKLADGLGPDGTVMPENIIAKPPTAELRADQKDEDSLPPYAVLDAILTSLIEDEKSFADIVSAGFDKETVARVEHMLYIAEYKRRQAPPGVKLTSKQFNRERRYPITNGFRDARQS